MKLTPYSVYWDFETNAFSAWKIYVTMSSSQKAYSKWLERHIAEIFSCSFVDTIAKEYK